AILLLAPVEHFSRGGLEYLWGDLGVSCEGLDQLPRGIVGSAFRGVDDNEARIANGDVEDILGLTLLVRPTRRVGSALPIAYHAFDLATLLFGFAGESYVLLPQSLVDRGKLGEPLEAMLLQCIQCTLQGGR